MRFTEAILLTASALLTHSFVNGLQPLQPTVQHSAQQKGATIRGLLDLRQVSYYCSAGYYECSATTCCPGGWPCCRDGNCCDPSSYCVIGTNGVIGCCPNGELCYGPAPGGSDPSPSPTYTTEHFTSTSTRTTLSTSISTSTFTTLIGAPTQTPGTQIIEVSVTDVDITWSLNWVQETSSCDRSVTSKSTKTAGSSFTYLFHYASITTYGYYYYFNAMNSGTTWEVFINGVSQHKYFSDSILFDNCTYLNSYYPSSSSTSTSQNITVLVHGTDSTASDLPWSFEMNKMLIQEQAASTSTSRAGSTSTTQNSITQTGFSSSAAGRTQPYRPLLVFGGILLAVLYWA